MYSLNVLFICGLPVDTKKLVVTGFHRSTICLCAGMLTSTRRLIGSHLDLAMFSQWNLWFFMFDRSPRLNRSRKDRRKKAGKTEII